MQHPVGAVVACSWPWVEPLDQVGSVRCAEFFGGGWVGRDSTFPNMKNKKMKVLM